MSAEHPQSPPGSNTLHTHEVSFHHFMLAVRWIIVVNIVVLPFFVLWFCTGAGFLTAAVTGLVLLAIGVKLLILGPGPISPPHDAALY